jgi:hypothetical protein
VDKDAESITLWIQSDYVRQRDCLDSFGVRQWTSKFIYRLGAVRVREGVYFVKTEHNPKVEALETFLHSIPGSVIFHTLPLLDDLKQRDMLRNAFESEVAEEIDTLIGEIQDIATACKSGKSQSVSNAKYEQLLNRYQALTEKTNEYSGLLEEKLGNTTSRLEIFMKSMVALTAHKK